MVLTRFVLPVKRPMRQSRASRTTEMSALLQCSATQYFRRWSPHHRKAWMQRITTCVDTGFRSSVRERLLTCYVSPLPQKAAAPYLNQPILPHCCDSASHTDRMAPSFCQHRYEDLTTTRSGGFHHLCEEHTLPRCSHRRIDVRTDSETGCWRYAGLHGFRRHGHRPTRCEHKRFRTSPRHSFRSSDDTNHRGCTQRLICCPAGRSVAFHPHNDNTDVDRV